MKKSILTLALAVALASCQKEATPPAIAPTRSDRDATMEYTVWTYGLPEVQVTVNGAPAAVDSGFVNPYESFTVTASEGDIVEFHLTKTDWFASAQIAEESLVTDWLAVLHNFVIAGSDSTLTRTVPDY